MRVVLCFAEVLSWHFCILPKHGRAWRKLFSSMYCSAKVLIVTWGMRGSRQRVDISQERGDHPPFQEMGINHPHHNLSQEFLQTERCTIKKWCTKRHSHYNLFKESLKTVRCTIKNDEPLIMSVKTIFTTICPKGPCVQKTSKRI